jgi:hypothetical protein
VAVAGRLSKPITSPEPLSSIEYIPPAIRAHEVPARTV